MVAQQPRELDEAPRDVWLLASTVLGEPIPVRERYPHICGVAVPPERTYSKDPELKIKTWWRDCAACARARGMTVR